MSRPVQVFLVDDDHDDLELFEEALRYVDEDVECITSSDSEALLRDLRQFKIARPDIIFLDLNMPLVDGRTLLMEIKKIPLYSNVPVVIYSTSSHHRDREETKKLGAFSFLTKPSSMNELIAQLKSILSPDTVDAGSFRFSNDG